MAGEGNGLSDAMRGEETPPRKPPRSATSGHPVGQVRGVLAERVVVSTALDPFLSVRALASYACVSVRKLRDYFDDPVHPLPHYRVGGKIVVRRSEFDQWMQQFRHRADAAVEQIVNEVLRDIKRP